IDVTPHSASIVKGETQQYAATGYYEDLSTQDLTNTATWASSDTGVATIDNAGLATGVDVGSTNITAAYQSMASNTAALTVHNDLLSIAVAPTSASIAKGSTQEYTATGFYEDGSTPDITTLVTWHSSNTSAATIDNFGVATGVGVGSTNITATSGS